MPRAKQREQRSDTIRSFRYRDVLGALFMASLVIGGYVIVRRVPMSVQHVAVTGPFAYIKRDQVRAVVTPYVSVGLLRFPVASLREQLLTELPWLKTVRVERVWPPGIHVYLTERRAVAYWGGQQLLSAAGVIFKPPQPLPAALPQFDGPADQAEPMLAFYEQVLHQEALAQHIQRLEVSPRHAWQLRLDNGALVRFGRTHIEQKWHHFCQAYKLLAEKHGIAKDAVFDFRYPNGFTVGRA